MRVMATVAAAILGCVLLSPSGNALALPAHEVTVVLAVYQDQAALAQQPPVGPSLSPQTTTVPSPQETARENNKALIGFIGIALIAIVIFGRKARKRWGKSAKDVKK